jgi:prefoldin subunit 5
MSEIKQKCELNDCNRAASTLCYCCKKSICTRHFTEHIEAVRIQVDPLANTINTMVENIQNLTIESFTEKPLEKLNQWKCDMHQLIDEIFSSKSKEIEELVEINKEKFLEYKKEQWENIMKIQEEVRQLVEDGDATFQQIELLKNQLAKIEENRTTFQKNFLSIDAQVFEHGFVTVSSTLNKSSICPTIPVSQFSSNLIFFL